MTDPIVAQKSPYAVDVRAGRNYFWCACGMSARQPFCDGSHKGSTIEPVAYKAAEDTTLYFCGCKQTGDRPFCDGTHNGL